MSHCWECVHHRPALCTIDLLCGAHGRPNFSRMLSASYYLDGAWSYVVSLDVCWALSANPSFGMTKTNFIRLVSKWHSSFGVLQMHSFCYVGQTESTLLIPRLLMQKIMNRPISLQLSMKAWKCSFHVQLDTQLDIQSVPFISNSILSVLIMQIGYPIGYEIGCNWISNCYEMLHFISQGSSSIYLRSFCLILVKWVAESSVNGPSPDNNYIIILSQPIETFPHGRYILTSGVVYIFLKLSELRPFASLT